MRLLDRLRRRPADRLDPAAVERALQERFAFLERDQGFSLARSERLPDGARVAYKNLPAGRGIVVFARSSRGVWAGVGALDEDGRLRPVDRDALELGQWRPLGKVDIGDRAANLEDAIAALARTVEGTRA